MAATSTSMDTATPTGPVDRYDWRHAGRARAILWRDTRNPRRVLFRSYGADGDVLFNSGWHGTSSEDTCTSSLQWTTRLARVNNQTAGDLRLTLDGFSYAGMEEVWRHDTMVFEKKVELQHDMWRLRHCSCGSRHSISLIYRETIDEWVDPDCTSVVASTCYELQCPR